MSSNKRYDARRDANEPEIIRALEQAHCSVLKLNDGLDLLVGRAGCNYLLEVKTDDGRISAEQNEFIRTWRGRRPAVVRSIDEALRAVGILSHLPKTHG